MIPQTEDKVNITSSNYQYIFKKLPVRAYPKFADNTDESLNTNDSLNIENNQKILINQIQLSPRTYKDKNIIQHTLISSSEIEMSTPKNKDNKDKTKI